LYFGEINTACKIGGPNIRIDTGIGMFTGSIVWGTKGLPTYAPHTGLQFSKEELWSTITHPVGIGIDVGFRFQPKLAFTVDAVGTTSEIYFPHNCCPDPS